LNRFTIAAISHAAAERRSVTLDKAAFLVNALCPTLCGNYASIRPRVLMRTLLLLTAFSVSPRSIADPVDDLISGVKLYVENEHGSVWTAFALREHACTIYYESVDSYVNEKRGWGFDHKMSVTFDLNSLAANGVAVSKTEDGPLWRINAQSSHTIIGTYEKKNWGNAPDVENETLSVSRSALYLFAGSEADADKLRDLLRAAISTCMNGHGARPLK
jgi:hypothetical protein